MRFRDGDWTLFDHDFKLGRTVWERRNPDGTVTHRTDYRVDPLIEVNTAQRNMAKQDWAGDYHHIASIPLNVYYDQIAEAAKQGDDAYLSRWLNDSDNRAWRTKSGNV